jgi:hypothetical protein
MPEPISYGNRSAAKCRRGDGCCCEVARGPGRLAAARAIVDDADTLAEIAAIGMEVARAIAPKMQDMYEKKTLAEVTLFTGALREAREASIARHEMLNGKQVNVDAHLSGGLAGLFAQLEVERKG